MNVHGFRYQMFNSKDIGPSIEAGYGPYSSLQQAIQTINEIFRDDPSAEAYTTTGYEPPLGLKFGVESNNIFTEYQYLKGNFSYNNTADGGSSDPGIIVVSSKGGGNGTIIDVKKGTTSQSTTLVTNNIAYIPMAEAPVNNVGGVDGLMSKEDKAKLDKLIEVLEDGLFNVDANFEVEGGDSSGSNAELEAKVNRIIAILGDLYNSGGNDAHFEVTETV